MARPGSMTLSQIPGELKNVGTAQNRKVYARHGVGQKMFGASYAHQKRLSKSIGIRSPALTERALQVAGKIGKVEVNHGETGCKTPDAAAYIRKTLAWRKSHPPAKKSPRKPPRSKK